MAGKKKDKTKTIKLRTLVTDPVFSKGPFGRVILTIGESRAPKPVSQKDGIRVNNSTGQKRDKLGRFA